MGVLIDSSGNVLLHRTGSTNAVALGAGYTDGNVMDESWGSYSNTDFVPVSSFSGNEFSLNVTPMPIYIIYGRAFDETGVPLDGTYSFPQDIFDAAETLVVTESLVSFTDGRIVSIESPLYSAEQVALGNSGTQIIYDSGSLSFIDGNSAIDFNPPSGIGATGAFTVGTALLSNGWFV